MCACDSIMELRWKAEALVKHYTAWQGRCATVAWVYGKVLKPFITIPDISQRTNIQTSAYHHHVLVRVGTFSPQHDTIHAHVLVTNCVTAYIYLFPGQRNNNQDVCSINSGSLLNQMIQKHYCQYSPFRRKVIVNNTLQLLQDVKRRWATESLLHGTAH